MTSARLPSEKLGTDSKSWWGSMRLLAYEAMPGAVALVYGEELMKHRLSDQHPLQPIRVKLAVELIRSTGLIEHAHLIPPRSAALAELQLVHSAEYVALVRKLSDPAQRGRVPPDLVDAAGFASADNPISDELHQGAALVVGATLIGAQAVESGAALDALEKVVAALLRRFKPPVLVTQDGCDTHYLDPLAHPAASTRIWPRVGKLFHELAHELCEGRWLALGGGGYAIYEVVPRAWTLFFAEMVERPDLAADLNDPSSPLPAAEVQDRVRAALRKDLRTLSEAHRLDSC